MYFVYLFFKILEQNDYKTCYSHKIFYKCTFMFNIVILTCIIFNMDIIISG